MITSKQLHNERVIRVFVSSTFRDMQAERDYLVKFIFPKLRKLCSERDVVWGEVDLRWGVTDEQKAEGKVLPICLAEINRCRPYFIGILGERYGWVPDEIPADLIEKETWLKDHSDHSVTELEIMHGVMKNQEMTKHAFFYFRDPSTSAKVEEELSKLSDYRPESEASHTKLTDLKENIRAKGFPVADNFADPKALGEAVLRDMTGIIDKLYPESSRPDPLDREAAEHTAYAKSRSGVYIGREEYFRRLDEHISGEGQPLVITCESGSGKSALLSNWALRYTKENTGSFLLMHFIGASTYSSDCKAMLRRIMGEFKRRFDIGQEIPDNLDELRSAFANWLYMVSVRSRVVIVIDALNQLEDRDGAPDLVWLPPVIPSNIRMILSTLPGRPLDDIKKRSWNTMVVEPFTVSEKRLFIEEYLKQYTKSLSNDQAALIVSQPQSSNPLYLKVLLEELRLFGKHEELNQQISFYLEAKSVTDLYRKILDRYEKDYETERPGLVSDAMTYIWASRRGLQESELLDILGTEGNPLPGAFWTPLYLAADQSLLYNTGLINFSHDYFRKAVEAVYVHSDQEKNKAHLKLSSILFKNLNLKRVVEEVPWQLSQAKAWESLKKVLTTPFIFISAWYINEFDIMAYWAQMEDNSISMVDAYSDVINNPEEADSDFIELIVKLLYHSRHNEEALTIVKYLNEKYKKTGDLDNYQSTLATQADILYSMGELEESLNLNKKQETICREVKNRDGLQRSLCGQSTILYARGDLKEALRLCKEQETICRELGDNLNLSKSLGNQGWILKDWGEYEEAMRLFKEKEHISREYGDLGALSVSLLNQAHIHRRQRDFEEAMRLFKEQEIICRKIGKLDGLQSSLAGQANTCYDREEYVQAIELYKEQESICRKIGDREGLQTALTGQANVHQVMGKLNEALELYKESERICREHGFKTSLSTVFGNQAVIYYKLGKLEEAMGLFKDQENIASELGNKEKYSMSLGNQATILIDRGEYEQAMILLKEQEKISRELGNKESLSNTINKQANICLDRGDLDEAIRLYREQEKLCREAGYKKGLSVSLGNQALSYDKKGVLLSEHGDYHGAYKAFLTALAIREDLVITHPSEVVYNRNLAVSYWQLAEVSQQENNSEAGEWWIKAFHQLQFMKQSGILDPSDEEALVYSKSMADQNQNSTK
jgi:tetratricopeptide (TPR) repeat protein